MASYPIEDPLVERPATGQTYVDILAAGGTEVRAPEAGDIMFVGDGVDAPFANNAPGVIVLAGDRSGLMHVFGFLDRASIEGLRTAGVWGWTGWTEPPRGTSWVYTGIPTIDDTIWSRGDVPRPHKNEGDLLGLVSSRGRMRWTTYNVGAVVTARSPLDWAARNALPSPRMTAPAGGGGALWLLLGLLLLGGKGRRR